VANHPSAEKRNRQSLKRNVHNTAWRSQVRTATRKLEAALKDKDQSRSEQSLKEAVSVIMKARSKGVYHRNTASRKVARLHRMTNRTLSQS
jgi:small subunit ribosomal protein S20